MAIYIDWANKIIHIPRNDMTLIQSVPTEIRQLDTDWFRLELKALESSPAGMTYPDTHKHNTIVVVGGVTLARVIEIINGYSITFEDGQYAVNLTGSNNNISDKTNVNQVSVRSSNSAGLVQSGSGLSTEQSTMLLEMYRLYGLDPTLPLVVTDTSRTVGGTVIEQTVSSTGSSTTVTRV